MEAIPSAFSVCPSISPAPDATMQGRNPLQGNHAEGNEFADSIRRGSITTKTVKGSDRERSDCYDLFDWVKDRCRLEGSNPSHNGRPIPARDGRGVGIARRQEYRKCVKCGERGVYDQRLRNMDWCEPCIWEFVRDAND